MVCETPKANHPHTSELLVAASTFSGRNLGVTNEPDRDCFVLCGGERRLVYEQEAPPVLNGLVMPRRCKLQHLASLGFRYFG